jgi:hypothetical protein
MTAFDVLSESRQLGLTLRAKDNGKLGFKPEWLCSPELMTKLRAHKLQLLALLRKKGVAWIEVFSDRIGETIFFAEDEASKAALVEAGADPWTIYTLDELRILVAHNRAKPFIPYELCKLHESKRTFKGRIAK